MGMPRKELQVQCGTCDHSEPINDQKMLADLRDNGKLQKIDKPEPALVRELFLAHLKNVRCPECKAISLVVSEVIADLREWGQVQNCKVCGQPIPAERLEIFPDTELCAICQESSPDDAHDYCPRCGGAMTVQQSSSKGIARYSTTCLDCGFSQ